MKQNTRKMLQSAALAAALGLSITPSYAGGLFGKGGIFRGDVGNFLDKNLEQPILTPAARGATVAAGAAAGAAVGALVGAPEAGAVVGAGAGNAVNDYAAGKR